MLLLSVFRAKRLNTLNREMKRRILKSEFNLLLYIFLYIFYFSRDIFIMGVIFFFHGQIKEEEICGRLREIQDTSEIITIILEIEGNEILVHKGLQKVKGRA